MVGLWQMKSKCARVTTEIAGQEMPMKSLMVARSVTAANETMEVIFSNIIRRSTQHYLMKISSKRN